MWNKPRGMSTFWRLCICIEMFMKCGKPLDMLTCNFSHFIFELVYLENFTPPVIPKLHCKAELNVPWFCK